MSLRSRFLSNAVRDMQDELPPRTPVELEFLKAPRTPEAKFLLKLMPAIDVLPLGPDTAPYMPMIKRAFEEIALDCEADGDEANAKISLEARTRVRMFLAALRRGLE